VDSKSTGSDTVPVRVRPPAPFITDNIDIVTKKPVVTGFFDTICLVSQKRSSVDIFGVFFEMR